MTFLPLVLLLIHWRIVFSRFLCLFFLSLSFFFRALNVGVPQNSYYFLSVYSHSSCDLIWSYSFKCHLHVNDSHIFISSVCLFCESASWNFSCQFSVSLWTFNSHPKFIVSQTYILILTSLPLTISSSRFSISINACFKWCFIPLVCVISHFSHVQLFVTPWTVACQASLSMGFSR